MTRENKLALVVGFGLILFVGILISDHFSIVRSQQAANLTTSGLSIEDPLAPQRPRNSDFIDLEQLAPPKVAPPKPAVNTSDIGVPGNNIVEGPRPEQMTTVNPGALAQGQSNGAPVSTPPGFDPAGQDPPHIPLVVQSHEIQTGDSLFGVCREYYGDVNLVDALAKFNGLDDPASLRAGAKLRMPPAEVLGGRSRAKTTPIPAVNPTIQNSPAVAPPVKPPAIRVINESTELVKNAPRSGEPANSSQTYTVKSGDSLAQIAHKCFGSKAKWKKLYDLNRNVIDDPDDLKVGTVLKLL